MSFKIQYTETARRDLRNVYVYIAYNLLVPDIATGQVQKIMREIRKLDGMPMRFKLYEDEPWHSKGLRFFSVNNYLVFCLPKEQENTVYIIRIIYSGRDVKKQLDETDI